MGVGEVRTATGSPAHRRTGEHGCTLATEKVGDACEGREVTEWSAAAVAAGDTVGARARDGDG